jgi:hypothetical protein
MATSPLGLAPLLLAATVTGCIAEGHPSDGAAAQLAATRALEHDRLVALESRVRELEREASSQRACDSKTATFWNSQSLYPDPVGEVAPTPASEAKFPEADELSVSENTPERERFEQTLEALRTYSLDWHSGISRQRREALRVLLRRDRALDRSNPWQ